MRTRRQVYTHYMLSCANGSLFGSAEITVIECESTHRICTHPFELVAAQPELCVNFVDRRHDFSLWRSNPFSVGVVSGAPHPKKRVGR